MPIMMVVINDVMAYMFGFFLGKNSLIQLSPKKTWEGYIGGGVSGLFFSVKTFIKLMQTTAFLFNYQIETGLIVDE